MESVLGWIPIHYLVVKHAVKFYVKNLYSGRDNDLFKSCLLRFLEADMLNGSSFISLHANYMKKFIRFISNGNRSMRNIDLINIDNVPYVQTSFSKFIDDLNTKSLVNRFQMEGYSSIPVCLDPLPKFTNRKIESTFYSFLFDCGFNKHSLARCGYSTDDLCPLCSYCDTVHHIFFDCIHLRNCHLIMIMNYFEHFSLDINFSSILELMSFNLDLITHVDKHIDCILKRRNDL